MINECRTQNAECRIEKTRSRTFLHSSFCALRSAFIGVLVVVATAASAADRPSLVVVISIDQFRYEYLTRFEPYFAPDGFRRFIDRGADFTNAFYPYSTTFTGPGHAAIGTGYTPSQSGIVGNDWFDRVSGKTVYCAADPRATPAYSPVNLQSDSLGDRLQEKLPGSRVYGVALKDRAAILMAGRKATTAYWFDPKRGGFTSSSYYRSNSTATSTFNATVPQYLADHPIWAQSSFIPAADLPKVTHDPESLRKYKTDQYGLGVAFPHPIASLDALEATPFGNGLVIGFAERLIEADHLGSNANAADLLFVGLSSHDYLGHFYGPDSLEVADSAVRTDRDVAGFLAWLDEHFHDRYTVALTADHGVQSIPEVARDLGREAGRVSFGTNGDALRNINLGASLAVGSAGPMDLIMKVEEPSLYVNWKTVAAAGLDGERVKRAIRDAALKVPGVSAAFTNSELMMTNPNPSPLEAAVRRSFRADRSGDVLVTLKPGYVWISSATGTSHGQPVDDDQHVPVMLWGADVAPRHYAQRVAPTDLARSIASMFGFDAGGSETRVLPCFAAGDTEAVVQAAIASAPHFEHLIAGKKLSDDVRKVIKFDAQPAETLPAGYARLDNVEINGDTANVTLWYGPIPPPPPPGVIVMACGTGHTYQLKRDANGTWRVVGQGVIVC
jgi:type I phosphodiesterase/nucleotide pyrophosphatase